MCGEAIDLRSMPMYELKGINCGCMILKWKVRVMICVSIARCTSAQLCTNCHCCGANPKALVRVQAMHANDKVIG